MTKRIKFFQMNKLVMTQGVAELLNNNIIDTIDILGMMDKHQHNEDDNPSQEDRETNIQSALKGGMFLSVYNLYGHKLYMVSYCDTFDFKVDNTTLMLAEEY